MREIKFRVWSGLSMSYNWTVNFPATSINKILSDMQENAGELMQYTGLKDKNGKEIYEGDIVSINDGELTCVVKYKEDDAQFTFYTQEGLTTYAPFHVRKKQCEIIGNLYEHPELMKP